MHIVFQHHLPLPVKRYGGAERIMFWHMLELVRLGHKVTLIGHKKSEVEKFGIKLIEHSSRSNSWIELIPKDCDIVHLQYNSNVEIDLPVIYTIHGNGQVGEKFPTNSVFVSKKHAENHTSEIFVNNALDLREYPFEKRTNTKWNNFLFLAKASWKVKNLSDCVNACKKFKKILHIAGGRYYWPSRKIISYGSVDNVEKLKLLKTSDALLFPVRWEEPFGIAVIEAMSQGVPVIGSEYGSLKDLINEEVGIKCKNREEFFDAVGNYKQFNSSLIRKYVEKNYKIELYTQSYYKLYERIISGEQLNIKNPLSTFAEKPETLLPF